LDSDEEIGMKLFGLFLLTAISAMASFIVTASFEPGEVGHTTDPLGPFSGIPIQFRGWQNGGSQVSLDGKPCSNQDACLVFLYDVNYSTPTSINSVSFTGDAFNGATFLLVNGSRVIGNSVSTGNVGHPVTFTMSTPSITGTSFNVELFDSSSTWTYVSNISINSVPEPATTGLLGCAFALMAVVRFRKSATKF
jgi:hypothetical protein